MVFKGVMVVLVVVLVTFGFVYSNLPGSVIELKASAIPRSSPNISYGNVPVFAENMRFNHNLLTYFVDASCDGSQKSSMIGAFNIFSDKTKIISFYETQSVEDSDIEVKCSDERVEISDSLFAAGEGGPSKIINTSYFKTIQKGDILLYNKIDCEYPIVELHELCHVFGFNHSDNPVSIMYNTSACSQRISDDMVELIQELYSIEPLSEISIQEVWAVKRGRYLDFNISVFNEGLIGAEDVTLTILSDGKVVETLDLGGIDLGYGRTLNAQNVRFPSKSVEVVGFFVDYDNSIRELDEDNNLAELTVEGS